MSKEDLFAGISVVHEYSYKIRSYFGTGRIFEERLTTKDLTEYVSVPGSVWEYQLTASSRVPLILLTVMYMISSISYSIFSFRNLHCNSSHRQSNSSVLKVHIHNAFTVQTVLGPLVSK